MLITTLTWLGFASVFVCVRPTELTGQPAQSQESPVGFSVTQQLVWWKVCVSLMFCSYQTSRSRLCILEEPHEHACQHARQNTRSYQLISRVLVHHQVSQKQEFSPFRRPEAGLNTQSNETDTWLSKRTNRKRRCMRKRWLICCHLSAYGGTFSLFPLHFTWI